MEESKEINEDFANYIIYWYAQYIILVVERKQVIFYGKKILPNIFIVVLPYVLVLNTYINMPIYNELTEYTVSLNLLLNMAIYFLIMCIYIYCFFIRKIVFNAITVYIGIGEILSIVFLSKYLPFALRNLMYSQIQLNIFVFGSFLVLYIMLLILHYKQKFYIHDWFSLNGVSTNNQD